VKEDVASSFGDAFSGPFLAWAAVAHSGLLVAWWSDVALYLAIPATVLVAFGIVVALAFGADGTSLCPSYRELARGPSTTPLPDSFDETALPSKPLVGGPTLPCAPELQQVFDRITELNATLDSYNTELLSLATPSEQEPDAGRRDKIQQLHSRRDAAIGEMVTLMGATLYHQSVQAGGWSDTTAPEFRHRDLCHA
jgi:hypothetical protein